MGPHELPEGFVEQWMRKYEDKVEALEELNAAEIVAERKRNVAVFSDAQVRRMEEILAKTIAALLESDALAGRIATVGERIVAAQALRFLLYMAGVFVAGFATAWFHLKGG